MVMADKKSYRIEVVENDSDVLKKRHNALISEIVQAVQAAANPKQCKAVVESFYNNSSNISNPPSFTKLVEFYDEKPVTLVKAILSIFYKDTQWSKHKCYAVAEKKSPGCATYVNITELCDVHLEDQARYRVQYYDARSFGLHQLPKFFVPLEGDGTEQNEESEDEEITEVNFIRFNGHSQRTIAKSKKNAPLEVACPCRCKSQKLNWVCSACKDPVFFDFSNHLYCKCGAHEKRRADYWCGDARHGFSYVPHSDHVFRGIKCEEINIILMGETGAGKSTWIDAIFNYLLHETLDEAVEHNQLEIPIPTHFLLEDDNKKLRKIYVGDRSANESVVVGASATQRPKSYTFMFHGRFYRFIDVPGVNDSRGIEQDRKNFEMIMQELYNYDRIHAICILIPSDAPRLTIAMKYCINELLTHLHQDAAKNLVFCFTKSRVNFYKAGNTQEILENYMQSFKQKRNVAIALNERTMYYFDNESFKFLCALQNGIESLKSEKADFVKSWDISAANTYRALDYIASLKPHLIRDMMSLNEAKRIILELTPISAEITKNIQTNKRIIEAKKVELQEMKKQTVDLKSQLSIKQTTLEVVPIDYPKTVCASNECIETIGIPGTTESQVLYRTICHDHCYLNNIEPGKYPNPGLQHCWAMSGMNCHQCGCSWETHLHIRYEQKQVTVDVANKEVEKVLASKNSSEVSVADVIKGLETRLVELGLKEKRIKTICAKFVAFLNQNAIAVINDAYGEYLEQSIKLAKNEVAVTGEGNQKVEQLEKYLAEYREEVAIIKEHIKNGTESITVTSIETMKKELEQMDEIGDQFKTFLQVSEQAQKNYKREDEVHLAKSSGGFVSLFNGIAKSAGDYARNWLAGGKEKPSKKDAQEKPHKSGKKNKRK